MRKSWNDGVARWKWPILGRLLVVAACSLAALGSSPALAGKKKVETRDDLPRYSYEIEGSVRELIQSDQRVGELAEAIRKDLERDLEEYEITDKTTLKDYYSALSTIYSIQGDLERAVEFTDRARDLEEKEAIRLTTGMGLKARVAARKSTGDSSPTPAFRAAFRKHYDETVRALPWGVVQDVIQGNKAQMEILSANLLYGVADTQIQPVVDEAGELSGPMAGQILGFYSALQVAIPLKDEIVSVLQAYVDSHQEEKENIWASRDVDLTGRSDLEPVLVAVWDTGVDPGVFGSAMFVNPNEKLDGVDNDGNGYVDDVHGIAYDMSWLPTTMPLYPMDDAIRPISELQDNAQGLFEMQASIDSPEARAFKTAISSLEPAEVQPFLEDMTRYSLYAHGTHVAGIAAAGNPSVSILVSRLTADHNSIPETPTLEEAKNGAEAFDKTIQYFQKHGVRVVNMSWVVGRSSFEQALEMNNVGKDAEERKKMAREMFEVMKDGMYRAFRSAPEILFVGGAGNSDNDITFDEFFPPMFELPNLMIAGAVDQAGEATSFTSFGPTVNVYANGFEVDSYVPGGDRVKFSGTSMASPNVANLAAKLLAIDPSLTPQEVISLIQEGADKVQEGDQLMRVIHPKRSIELLEHKKAM